MVLHVRQSRGELGSLIDRLISLGTTQPCGAAERS